MSPRLPLLAAAVLAASLAACKSEEPKPQPAEAAPREPLTVTDSADITVTARVKSVDHTARRLTLTDSSGHTTEFAVSNQVQRLDEVKSGDIVKAQYRATLIAELRPPTAEEAQNPIAIVALAGRAGEDRAPAAGAAVATRVVTTVEAIDIPNMRVTLMGPMGDSTTVRARSKENISKLRIGDTIVITYAEASALLLVKIPND